MRYVWLGLLTVASAFAAPSKVDSTGVTYYKNVLPVLQKNCQGCHRPGEAAPMSFLTYKETRPWAKAMKEAVLSKKMPPWFADPHVGKFANDRTLSQADIDLLARWADTGATAGNPKDAPAPLQFIEGWNIGKPDLVVEMPSEFNVPSSGTVEYTYFVIPLNLKEDKWLQMIEARPGNRAVVHHIIAFAREPGSKWMKDAKPGEPFVPQKGGKDEEGANEFLVGYAPGTIPEILKPGQAKLIKAGSDIVLQMHYTTNGKEAKDQTRVGLVFAKEPPKERVMMLAATTKKFAIPPGADNYQVDSKMTLQGDTTLEAMFPHMHLRGKAFEFRATYPDGRTEDLLKVPNYSFSWQLSYLPIKPIFLPKGTTISCSAWYDNSANNPNNPDPKMEVRYGDQSWEEMMFGFFEVSFDAKVNPGDLLRAKKKPQSSD
jgi:mono/diheme cytochrome c family protein